MSRTTTSIEAFTQAVLADYQGEPRYPAGSVVLPAAIELDEFVAAMRQHDPHRTTVVFVRDDGAELILTPRPARSLAERVRARFGVLPLDVTVRPAHGRELYHDRRSVRTRDVVAYERRVFAFA
jgi:hypothetical protein